MKRLFALTVSMLLTASILTGCFGNDDETSSSEIGGTSSHNVASEAVSGFDQTISDSENITSKAVSDTQGIISDIVSGTESLVSDLMPNSSK